MHWKQKLNGQNFWWKTLEVGRGRGGWVEQLFYVIPCLWLMHDKHCEGWNFCTGGRCTTACAVVNQLFNKLFWNTQLLISFFQKLSLKLIDNCTSSGCCIFQPAFWCKLKNPFFAKFCTKFVTFFAFFQLFSMKNVEIYSRWCTFPLYSPVGHIA